jgi:hypothetical protein
MAHNAKIMVSPFLSSWIKEDAVREYIFDMLTRSAAQGVSRRGSLATLGGAGLAALFGNALPAEAKKKNKKKKKKSDPFKKCKAQVEQCQIGLPPLGGTPAQVLCCESFGVCDITQFFLCLIGPGTS